MTDLTLLPDAELRIFATDLTDTFYSFAISAERARSNCLSLVCSSSDLQSAKASAIHQRSYAQAKPEDRVLPSLLTEPMGDVDAVDYMQEVRANVFVSGGAWLPEHRVESLQLPSF